MVYGRYTQGIRDDPKKRLVCSAVTAKACWLKRMQTNGVRKVHARYFVMIELAKAPPTLQLPNRRGSVHMQCNRLRESCPSCPYQVGTCWGSLDQRSAAHHGLQVSLLSSAALPIQPKALLDSLGLAQGDDW
eukprot:Skav211261  [mRNA]  locus=scaffold3676:184516:184911:- [translate_table: standard]